ncbi:MAG: hypothetical protein COV01_02150 [Candidatus Taylorbacteria bacterium CG10_big_fil_rev_8_21_14_0_10_41_48]|uniref:Uncharacterized protein n=1 Tax=Candidatus Taylorbacteria bacterium CG10_big_fil_rev_8_21_14_0_10_41_48 TaxID=1975024 RepID=A0A2M8LCC7_9BACT|nr:MAG: hypothetical protein COV01_02150 [Candidatus Taylorbacteria bacterium CG10_big_fil_rev_8_21_14_0_10_41_48]
MTVLFFSLIVFVSTPVVREEKVFLGSDMEIVSSAVPLDGVKATQDQNRLVVLQIVDRFDGIECDDSIGGNSLIPREIFVFVPHRTTYYPYDCADPPCFEHQRMLS